MSSRTRPAPRNVSHLARAERAELADFLADLPPEQWDAPTPCGGWAVRDVVAHMVSYEHLGLAGARAESLTRSQRVRNTRLRAVTGWAPRFPSVRDGLSA